MSKIVFFCIPAHGHTNPTLGVVRELVNRGHEVWYYSYEQMRRKIEDTGAKFISCDDYDAEQKLTPADSARIGSDLAFSTKVLVDTTLALDEMVCRDMLRLNPDCIVADSMAIWGKAAAMKLGIPFVSSTTTFAFNKHSSRGMKQGPKELMKMLFSMPKINREMKRLRSRGYPVKSILDIIANDDSTHTIVYTSRKFQPCSETFSDCYSFVGPSVRPAEEKVEKKREKLVYISMGTVNNCMMDLYLGCVRVFSGLPYQVILSVGDNVNIKAFGELPEQIAVYPRVDQIGVLQEADVFVSHCGMNSVSESLYFGVPLVLLPQTSEQEAVASRTEELGAGCRPENLTPEGIAEAARRVLEDPSFREKAGSIAADFRACSGPKGAADKIEAMMTQQ